MQALMIKLATLIIAALFAFTVACSQATETTPDVRATVDAAVAATVAAATVPPSLPTQFVPTQTQAIVITPTPVPTHTLTPSLTPTPFATPILTLVSTPDPTLVAYISQIPQPTSPVATPTPMPTAIPTPTPIPFDIREANCQHEDLTAEMSFHDFSLAESEGPYSWEPWGIRQWYVTDWWTDDGYRIRCRTNIFDSVEDARWSLNYSTALQRVWGQEGLLEHRQVFAPISGDDTLAIEIEVGRRYTLSGREATTHVYVAKFAMFLQGNIVVVLEYGSTLKEVCPNNPILCSYAPDTFFMSSWQPITDIASRVDERLLAQLARGNR